MTTNESAFAAAFWEFKMNDRRQEEPTAAEFGLHPEIAESIARQCQIEFEQRAMAKVKSRKPR